MAASALERLIELGGEPLGPGLTFALPDTGGAARTRELEALLAARDGFTAFEGALVVFPANAPAGPIDLMRLNGGLWRTGYWHQCGGLYAFAADALGELFALVGDKVVRFATETGTAEPFADTLEDWAARALADPAAEVAWPFIKSWQDANGPLRPGWRLTGREPFVLGGSFEMANLQAIDLLDILAFRGRLATKIHELPPGAEIRMADAHGPPPS